MRHVRSGCKSREPQACFIGAAGARVVAKRSQSEKVGVFARRGDAIEVVEYSELGAAEAEAALEGAKYYYLILTITKWVQRAVSHRG
jgi:hypothetical protein